MTIINRIHQKLYREFFKYLYHAQLDKLERTPSLSPGNGHFILLSMVHHRDVKSYIVAAKSFARFTSPERLIVICDPSITEQDRKLLALHIPFIELYPATDFRHNDIPQGGTWERLFAISSFSPDGYIVQLDADTLTINDPIEVNTAIQEGKGFVIGEEPNQKLIDFQYASSIASGWVTPSAHIQAIAEFKLTAIQMSADTRYVRGCSGFTGFPKNINMKSQLIDFSRRMQSVIGERWNNWGTEQVTSNYLIANANDTKVLPYPKYCNPIDITDQTVFVHFIGSHRFTNRKYELATRSVISDLAK